MPALKAAFDRPTALFLLVLPCMTLVANRVFKIFLDTGSVEKDAESFALSGLQPEAGALSLR